ncbi:hypothetical protein P154DRAFT_531849 [Amniculicola lignicola CBS 123094]|uniref:BTB domain-containing protein n=1 Tax=Amniculicola lignicola CBS 123094 TaxID=1392246 RepID=A0A6A5WQN0_9PLEO|nr:hypothetical protein P154DRAFT_531849 [Amniculicola lignicola CBS 123094]
MAAPRNDGTKIHDLGRLVAYQKELLRSGKHSDFFIICGNDNYAIHLTVVGAHTDYFESVANESALGGVDLKDDDPVAVKYMIQYLYEMNYTIPSDSNFYWDVDLPVLKWTVPGCGIVGEIEARGLINEFRAMLSRATQNTVQTIIDYILREQSSSMQLNDRDELFIDPMTIGTRTVEHMVRLLKSTGAMWPHTFDREGLDYGLVIHAKVYRLAEKYKIEGLQDCASEKIRRFFARMKMDSEDPFCKTQVLEMMRIAFDSPADKNDKLQAYLWTELMENVAVQGMRRRVRDLLDTSPGLKSRVEDFESAGT